MNVLQSNSIPRDLIYYIKSRVLAKIDTSGIFTEQPDSNEQELRRLWPQVYSLLSEADHSEELIRENAEGDNPLVSRLNFLAGQFKSNIVKSDWKKLDELKWRILYSFTSLLKCLLLICISHDSLETALREIDDALIMSPPICNNILGALGQRVHDSLVKINNAHVPKVDCVITSFSPGEAESKSIDLSAINPNIPVESTMDLVTFESKYLNKKCPVVIKDAINHWRACQLWSVNYFSQIFGSRWIPIEVGSSYLDDTWRQEIVQFNDFAHQYLSRSIDDTEGQIGYLAQYDLFHQVPLLRKDISLPDYCSLGDPMNNVQINVWIGPAGTVSPLHRDPTDNLLTQIYGYKHIKLISSDVSPDIVYPYPASSKLSNTSRVDINSVDTNRFPRFHETKHSTYQCILGPGDMLFIPNGWWHFVQSLSSSCSISFWW